MKAISVKGTASIKGCIEIQGSKNTVLPIMAATLLTNGRTTIYNCPMIRDVFAMCELLHCLGVETSLDNNILVIDTSHAHYAELPYELTCMLRSSILLLGPMLVRFHRAAIGMPGGCAIGERPIDIHLEGLVRMHVDVACKRERLECSCYHLQGCEYHMGFASVGATENLIMTAVGAMGRTTLKGVAKEPEITELCRYLVSLGALIEGIGTDTLVIKGMSALSCCDYRNPFDRVVAGTYILLASVMPSELKLTGIDNIGYIANVIRTANALGAAVVAVEDCVSVTSDGHVTGGAFTTGVYPEFPTDLQPVLAACLTRAADVSEITETIFENRFSIVCELQKLGADVMQRGRTITVSGSRMQGHTVRATDLRQGAALIVAGILGNGYTTITDVGFIERGYEDIVSDLRCVGVEITYI